MAAPPRVTLSALVLLLVAAAGWAPAARAQDGVTCAACTLVVGLFEQLAVVHSEEVIEAAKKYCATLPEPELQAACVLFLDRYGERIIEGIVLRQTADIICRRIGLCTDPTCNLFPLPPPSVLATVDPNEQPLTLKYSGAGEKAICDLPVISEFCKMLERFVDQHLPLQDADLDSFSTIPTFRGWHWRGRDCNDEVKEVYPGRKVSLYGPEVDHNCNGIYGVDENGVSWEERLCSRSDMRGLIFLGDSATAHFSIPPNYINASAITRDTYDQILLVASNELDWPHQSGSTGFLEQGNKDCPGPVDSIYKRLRERNRCNHRDYHNIGVNGARVGSMEKIAKSTNRNETTDYPVVVTYALIGNDICNSNPTTERMTTPQDFKQRVLNTMVYLDTILPFGSHVLFIGIVDGRVLWDTMNAETHPINVTYAALYDYLNCLEISPCAAWLNSNQTYRDAASERAVQLNQQYIDIINEYRFNRFDMAYFDYPIFEVIEYWESQGGKAKDLIELADGFHPSQLANALGAQFFWERMEQELPSWLGPANPNNALIDQLFGDQGGH